MRRTIEIKSPEVRSWLYGLRTQWGKSERGEAAPIAFFEELRKATPEDICLGTGTPPEIKKRAEKMEDPSARIRFLENVLEEINEAANKHLLKLYTSGHPGPGDPQIEPTLEARSLIEFTDIERYYREVFQLYSTELLYNRATPEPADREIEGRAANTRRLQRFWLIEHAPSIGRREGVDPEEALRRLERMNYISFQDDGPIVFASDVPGIGAVLAEWGLSCHREASSKIHSQTGRITEGSLKQAINRGHGQNGGASENAQSVLAAFHKAIETPRAPA
jgi:hypothetical protein